MKDEKVHIIGIGGIGISALARWFLSQGYKVSGSDASPSSTIKELRKEGARISIGHKAKNLPKQAKLVVFSAAIPKDNSELRAARHSGIPAKSYAQALGDLVIKQYKALAVAGAHGKSTTTALLSLILTKAGLDPTVIIGTKLKEFKNSNFRKGRGAYLAFEADEYRHSFLHYSPTAAIITNIDREHLDYFKNLTAIKNAFLRFMRNIRPGGILVANKDDKNLFSLKNQIKKIAKRKKIKITWYSIRDKFENRIRERLERCLKIPGEHNISNALAVYTMSKILNIKDKDIFEAIERYHGAWRRMEYRGTIRKSITNKIREYSRINSRKIRDIKIDIYDDYAHHPTEVKATLQGLSQKYSRSHIICVFQPHQAKRLQTLFKEFTSAFDNADSLILLDVYRVPGRDKLSQNVNSLMLAKAIEKHLQVYKQPQNRKKQAKIALIRLRTVIHIPYSSGVANRLKSTLIDLMINQHESAIIIMMGAGDIVKYTDSLLKS